MHHVLPTLTSTLSRRMLAYFDKCHAILTTTPGILAFPISDHFLGYNLCPPSVKDWRTRMDFTSLFTAIPTFPWLTEFISLPINPTQDYGSTTLAQAATDLSGPSLVAGSSPPRAAEDLASLTPGTAAECFCTSA